MRRSLLAGLLVLLAPASAVAEEPVAAGPEAEAPSPAPPEASAPPGAPEIPAAPSEEPEPALALDGSTASGDQDEPAAEAQGSDQAPPAGLHLTLGRGFELALELDSNLARIPSTSEQARGPAGVLRLGGHAQVDALWPSGHLLHISGAANLRAAPTSSIVNEDLAHLALELQWTRPARDGAMRAGLRASGHDISSLRGVIGDRTYRSAAADLLLVLFGERARVVVGVGPRGFQYKMSDEASWLGGGATARGEFPLWRGGEEDERSLELSSTWAVEQRAYFGKASTNICAPGDTYMCVAATRRRRGDRVMRGGVALTYTSALVASVDVQLTSLDSNSFGQSWQGVRVRAATTISTAVGFASLTATVNAERYPEGLVVQDLDLDRYETLDADNRSSLELRLSRRVFASAELELRLAMWRDLFRDTGYQRYLASVGVIWGR